MHLNVQDRGPLPYEAVVGVTFQVTIPLLIVQRVLTTLETGTTRTARHGPLLYCGVRGQLLLHTIRRDM